MKHILVLFAFIATSFIISSCKDDSTQVSNNIVNGDWRITYYYDKDKDETSDYAGMTFTFNDNGDVAVVSGTLNYSGTWSTGNDDSKEKFYLTFSSPALLIEISDDWVIDSQSNSKIELSDDSDNGTELLTFEKT
ncbi:MAG: hypothetical protein C0592_13630 [Marinilabiliales bacterium]|nr:MAG: hypothetical protein C0592_13630 [Marinilabiliales bacterium]